MQLSRGGPARKELEQELNEAVRERKFEKAAELRDKMQHLTKPADGKRARCVTGADIAWVVSARTGIPVGRLTAGERERLLGLEGLLSAQVVGQSKAVSAVAEAVRRGYCGIRDGSRPIACLLFTGPTGVGKTELCRALGAGGLRQPGRHDPAGHDGIYGKAVGLPPDRRASRVRGL